MLDDREADLAPMVKRCRQENWTIMDENSTGPERYLKILEVLLSDVGLNVVDLRGGQ